MSASIAVPTGPDHILMTEKQAADYLNVSTVTLQRYRYKSCGPQYSRLGNWKGIRYRLSDLQAWLNQSNGDKRSTKRVAACSTTS